MGREEKDGRSVSKAKTVNLSNLKTAMTSPSQARLGRQSHRPAFRRSQAILSRGPRFFLRNPKYMQAFAKAWPDPEFVQRVVAQIPWSHHVRLLDKTKTPEERVFYVTQALVDATARN